MKEIIKKFDYLINSPEPQIVNLLTEVDELKGEFKAGLNTNLPMVHKLRQSTILSSTGSSTRIEGAKLSDHEVEDVMKGLSLSKFADRDIQEVQGYLETLSYVFDNYQNLLLRESTVLSLHKNLLKYSVKDSDHRGDYKKRENQVGILDSNKNIIHVIFEPTKAYLSPKETQELLIWTKNSLEKNNFHSLLIIANFVVEFLKIHPFQDGNGRLSRILTNLLLLQSGYAFVEYASHEQAIEQRKDEYYIALRQSQKTLTTKNPNINHWLIFFLTIIKEQAKQALLNLKSESAEDLLSPNQSKVWAYISSVNEASPSEIAKVTGVALSTTRQALNKLMELKKIKRIGQGRGTRYIKY